MWCIYLRLECQALQTADWVPVVKRCMLLMARCTFCSRSWHLTGGAEQLIISKTKTDFWEDSLNMGPCNISQVVLPKHEVLDIQLPAEILSCSFYDELWTEEDWCSCVPLPPLLVVLFETRSLPRDKVLLRLSKIHKPFVSAADSFFS